MYILLVPVCSDRFDSPDLGRGKICICHAWLSEAPNLTVDETEYASRSMRIRDVTLLRRFAVQSVPCYVRRARAAKWDDRGKAVACGVGV